MTVRSDSYLGLDVHEDIKLEVCEAKEAVTEHPQVGISNSTSLLAIGLGITWYFMPKLNEQINDSVSGRKHYSLSFLPET